MFSLMKKDFDRWNGFKKSLEENKKSVDFLERDIWWCSVGVNVGREQQSQTENFSRPVIIIKRFTPDIFLAVPLTTQMRENKFRIPLKIGGVENDALILHMRSYDRKRLVRKVCMLQEREFKKVLNVITSITS